MGLFRKRRIYLDYASAPPVAPEAREAMREAEELLGNPGAIHAEGVAAKKLLEDSRARIASLLGCKARELVFTSGLTESNNLAILGCARYIWTRRARHTGEPLNGTHWIVSAIEHDSVLACFGEIERMGGAVTFVDPDARGVVLPELVKRALRPETVFVSVGWANNEIGAIQPLGKIALAIRNRMVELGSKSLPVFHSDAGQAPLYLPTLARNLGVDLLSLGGNKLYGPHGIGALYVKKGTALAPLVLGGKQEHGARAGTESVALAAGFAAAFEAVARERDSESKRLQKLRRELARELAARIPDLVVNGEPEHALPHMLNVSIPDINAEYVALALDHAGIAVSTKSACREGEASSSHVVEALERAGGGKEGKRDWRAQNTLRFSLGRGVAARDIIRTVKTLAGVVQTARTS